MTIKTKISQHGNSRAFTLPKKIMETIGDVGDVFLIKFENNQIILTKENDVNEQNKNR